MSDKAPIVVCLPWTTPHEKHMQHFIEWYAINKQPHALRLCRIFGRALHQAQGRAVDMARQHEASHILFTEHDQWGYPIDGLDVLLEADKDVIGFKSYFKKYPFLSMAFRKKDPAVSMLDRCPNFVQIEGVGKGEPIQKVDLLSWAFTLVKMSVFDRMKEAGKNPFEQWGKVPTDSYFCQYCEDIGVDRWVHFGFTIGHGDIAPDAIPHHRRLHESINASRRQAGKMRVLVEDEYGVPYGEATYVPESARAILELHGHHKELEGV